MYKLRLGYAFRCCLRSEWICCRDLLENWFHFMAVINSTVTVTLIMVSVTRQNRRYVSFCSSSIDSSNWKWRTSGFFVEECGLPILNSPIIMRENVKLWFHFLEYFFYKGYTIGKNEVFSCTAQLSDELYWSSIYKALWRWPRFYNTYILMHNGNYDRSTNRRFRYIKYIKGLNGNDCWYLNCSYNERSV